MVGRGLSLESGGGKSGRYRRDVVVFVDRITVEIFCIMVKLVVLIIF